MKDNMSHWFQDNINAVKKQQWGKQNSLPSQESSQDCHIRESCSAGETWDNEKCECVGTHFDATTESPHDCDFIESCPAGETWDNMNCKCLGTPETFEGIFQEKCHMREECQAGESWDDEICQCVTGSIMFLAP